MQVAFVPVHVLQSWRLAPHCVTVPGLAPLAQLPDAVQQSN